MKRPRLHDTLPGRDEASGFIALQRPEGFTPEQQTPMEKLLTAANLVLGKADDAGR